ncbi:MAG TPA: hypothetical protein VK051_06070 [Paenalcaligenes sp.]|nr:hypothetical protein [Paenalcaligenes sp.]
MSITTILKKKTLPLCTALALGSLCATTAHADSFKRDGKTYKSVGVVQGELDNQKAQWIVIDSHLVSALPASALWEQESLDMPDQEQIMEQFQEAMSSGELSPEEAKQIELIAKMLSEAGPMIEAFESMGLGDIAGMESISIDIDAFDPNQDDPFDSGRISIHTSISAEKDLTDLPIYANDVDITYILSGGDTLFLPETAYWSEDDYGHDAPEVKFTKVDLDENGSGRVKGEFSATLCYWEKAKMMQGTNKDKCMPFKGDFDTAIYPMPKE